MPLTLLLLAIALVLIVLSLAAGFWLGRRYRVLALRNHEDDPPQACETQPVADEPSLPAAAEAAMPQREPPPQPFGSEVSARKACCRRQGHDR